MKAFRHPIILALIAEALAVALGHFFPYNWADDALSSPSFWILLPHIPAILFSSVVLQPQSDVGQTVAMILPTFIAWIPFFYAVRYAWRYARRNYASHPRAA